MVIKIGQQFWRRDGEGFEQVSECEYTPKPSADVIAQMKADYEQAFEADLGVINDPTDHFGFSYQENRDAVIAKWGAAWVAMRAYEAYGEMAADNSDVCY